MYQVVVVPDDAADITEQLGSKPKFWYDDKKWLFKEGRPGTGDDWSEKVASELCELLMLPHPEYEFATWKGRRGVVTSTFVPRPNGRLVHGNEVLAKVVSGYPGNKLYRVRQHTLRLVLAIVRSARIQPPIVWSPVPGIESAIDVFVGYLLFDAWIANQDRHHENWGFVVSPDRTIHLAPSYDHASSLGSNETDDNRRERLTTRDMGRSVERYVEKARSAFFVSPSDVKPMSTLSAFEEAAKTRPLAAKAWLDRLQRVGERDIEFIFTQVPNDRISPVAIDFARTMLKLNRDRIVAVGAKLQ